MTDTDQGAERAWLRPGDGGAAEALAPGMYLGYRYELVDRLGRGGMASVWRAVDKVLDRLVAVKVLASGLMADGEGDFLERFRVEARAAAQLSHPHITSVFDYGEWDLPGGERVAFIVMELLDGESLAARLQRGPLPWPEALAACAQVAQALAAAHRRGMVHRDVKPGNVVLTEAGAKVLDFGIAAMTGDPSLTASGGVLGTASYVAPELLAGELVTPAADVYGLGVVLFETLTGAPPPREGPAAAAPAPSLELLPGLPAEVAPLCRRCLARRPHERPSSAEVAKRLQAALRAGAWRGASDTALLPQIVDQAAPPRRAALLAGRARSRDWLLGGALGAALVAAAVVLAIALRPQERPPADRAAAGGASTASSAATATTTPTTSPRPAASQPLAALEQLQRGVDDGLASGEIRADVGNDLDNLIGNLRERLADGRFDGADRRIEELHRKLDERAHEGAIVPSLAQALSRALDSLAQALPSD